MLAKEAKKDPITIKRAKASVCVAKITSFEA
jgi:hypothetical protein